MFTRKGLTSNKRVEEPMNNIYQIRVGFRQGLSRSQMNNIDKIGWMMSVMEEN